MIKIPENERRIFENRLKFIIDDLKDYLNGSQSVSFKSTLIEVEDLLDYFASNGNSRFMRLDTIQLFKRKDIKRAYEDDEE